MSSHVIRRRRPVRSSRLFVAQPAVSQEIRSLERELGESLFDRNSRSVRLAEAGRALLPLANRTLAAADALTAEFTSRSALLTGTLSLGTVDGVEHTWRRTHPWRAAGASRWGCSTAGL
ncbi:LysR family transcriptional regulator [Nonomuraea jabiensis]|uniref:LysR family transcriptional regulator n=1 Tax=Nonomuraea jabiensis TaxID=882448 RepID=UPI00367651D5